MAITVVQPITKAHERFDPIPLTPEILTEWCGFEKTTESLLIDAVDETKFIFQNTKMLCGHNFELNYYGFSDSSLDGFYFYAGHPYDTHVKTVHHLQNLFFALTGKELEIKIPEKA